jgi:hypothetical protein
LHVDKDYNSYSYGIGVSIFKENDKLTSKEEELECDGGEFVVPSYKICIDYGACDNIT